MLSRLQLRRKGLVSSKSDLASANGIAVDAHYVFVNRQWMSPSQWRYLAELENIPSNGITN